jgi:hypothetical protein
VVEAAIRHPEHQVFAGWPTINALIRLNVAFTLAGGSGSTGSTSFSNASYLRSELVEHYGMDHR